MILTHRLIVSSTLPQRKPLRPRFTRRAELRASASTALTTAVGPKTPDSPGTVPDPKPYILWFIKMQRGESCARSPGGLIIAATCKGMGEQDQVAQQEPRTAQERALELLRACLVRERVGVASYAPLCQNEVPTDFSDAPACCSDGWPGG